MAGVAFSVSMLQSARKVTRVHSEHLWNREGQPVRFLTKSKLGRLETDLLEQMVADESEIEVVAGGELVMAYHMKSLEHREQYFKRMIPVFATRTLQQPVERSCSRVPDGTYWGP